MKNLSLPGNLPAAVLVLPRPNWRQVLQAVCIILSAYLFLCIVGAASSYADALRRGVAPGGFGGHLYGWLFATQLMIYYSCALYAYTSHHPNLMRKPSALLMIYVATLLFFLPLELLFQAAVLLHDKGKPLSVAMLLQTFWNTNKFFWFLDFAVLSCAFIAQLSASHWQYGRWREQLLHQAHADNLNLHLQLEQQRLLALRGQLEPHFMFNALNAISALVRSDDKKVALSGISRLSELLRYALLASERETVSLRQELQFIDDYLALQRLRYEERLQFVREVSEDLLRAECPPLILQPLVENALRHDLDCHTGASDIRLEIVAKQEMLCLRLCNRVHADVGDNPGLGLGLRQTQTRLELVYGAQGRMQTGIVNGRFVVELEMPLFRDVEDA